MKEDFILNKETDKTLKEINKMLCRTYKDGKDKYTPEELVGEIIYQLEQTYKQGREDMMGEINKIHENMNDWSDAEYRANLHSEISLLTNKQ